MSLLIVLQSVCTGAVYGDDLVITLRDGSRHVFPTGEIESISFARNGTGQSTPMEALQSILRAINSSRPEGAFEYLGHSDGSGPLSEGEKALGEASRTGRMYRELLELKSIEFTFGDLIVDSESEGIWHVVPAEPKEKSWIVYFAFLEHDGMWYLCDVDKD